MIPLQKDSGQSQVDFLVGFTIFIFSLIVVANMVPSLLVGLQRTTAIDYDAVAYRTAVVLAEDPGEPSEQDNYQQNNNVAWDSYSIDSLRSLSGTTAVRFGLAQSRETPNILSPRKVERFFDTTLTPTDYRNFLIFGDIQYLFNVTLVRLDTGTMNSTGNPYPNGGYGYIRRYVKIRNYTNATVDNTTYPEFNQSTQSDSSIRTFDIRLDGQILYRDQAKMPYSPAYVIDPTRDTLVINITGLRGHLNRSDWSPDPLASGVENWTGYISVTPDGELTRPPTYATLTSITFETTADPPGIPPIVCDGDDPMVVVYYGYDSTGDGYDDELRRLDGNPTNFILPPPGVRVANSINIEVKGLDDTYMFLDQGIVIRLSFEEPIVTTLGGTDINPPRTLFNGTFIYDYNHRKVTQPPLSPGILEVAIW